MVWFSIQFQIQIKYNQQMEKDERWNVTEAGKRIWLIVSDTAKFGTMSSVAELKYGLRYYDNSDSLISVNFEQLAVCIR